MTRAELINTVEKHIRAFKEQGFLPLTQTHNPESFNAHVTEHGELIFNYANGEEGIVVLSHEPVPCY